MSTNKALHRAHESDAFILSNGIKVRTLEELLREITLMPYVEFDSYARRNDFSRWVRNALYNYDLAESIYGLTDKRAVEEIIRACLLQRTQPQTHTVKNLHPQKTHTKTHKTHHKKASEEDLRYQEPLNTKASEPEPTITEENLISQEEEERYEQPNNQLVVNQSLTQYEIDRTKELLKEAQQEVNKVFIGQEEVVRKTLITIMCGAHALLEGVPGLAKTLLIETLAKVVSGTNFKRIQFMPDTLPSDIIGGQMFNPASGEFKTIKGPVFTNFLLADEINRAPPKTHSALMEAMQEKKISIDKTDYPLDKPFFVLATQNPLENKGTYELPEAVLDRFMFKIMLGYPKREHERIILTDNSTTKKDIFNQIKVVMTKEDILAIQERTTKVFISDEIREYILDIVEATRGKNKKVEGVRFLQYGAGVRASIYLTIASKAYALSQGRGYVLPEDVRQVVPDVLRHRLALNYIGKAHNISTDKIIEEVLKKTSNI